MRLALLQTHNGFRSLRNVIQITPQLKNGRFNFSHSLINSSDGQL